MRTLLLALVLFGMPGGTTADDSAEPSPTQSEAAPTWTARRLSEMQEYRAQIEQDGNSVTLELIEQPLLNWSNPLRKTMQGALFLWTMRGEPQFVCCTFPDNPLIVHEVQSLAEAPVLWAHEQRPDQVFPPPQFEFETIPDAPASADGRPRRLIQMRKLAARYSAEVNNPERTPVRLLTQPIYRHPPGAAVDGAVFAFVQGTDPECLLHIKQADKDWKARVVRMTSVRLIVHRDGQLLREFDPSWEVADPSYKNFYLSID